MKIFQHAKLKGKIKSEGVLIGRVSKQIGYVDYVGDYEVTPKINEQSLQTKDKHLTENVTIKSIPYFETSNTSGGNTVYIGSEV